ncbi:MAG: hypothetical protein KGK09_00970, partial [Burkholderiales bacterium]|nr:hypothetical protein [Burkholderiales bacterium]
MPIWLARRERSLRSDRRAGQFGKQASFARRAKESAPAIPGHGNGPLLDTSAGNAGLAVLAPGMEARRVETLYPAARCAARQPGPAQRETPGSVDVRVITSASATTKDSDTCCDAKNDLRGRSLPSPLGQPSIVLHPELVPRQRMIARDFKVAPEARRRPTTFAPGAATTSDRLSLDERDGKAEEPAPVNRSGTESQ